MKIGVISDTHGLLRDEVIDHLIGCDVILHAGDVTKGEIIDKLHQIAPVYVVRGNNDKEEWAKQVPLFLRLVFEGRTFYMVHQKKDVPKDLAGIDLIIVGHSHRYEESMIGQIPLLNPGSCGGKRFNLPITMAIIHLEADKMQIEPITLAV